MKIYGGISVQEIFSEKHFYSIEFNKIVSLITFNKDKTKVYGSYAYRGLNYTSDIDLFEVVDVRNIKVFIKQFQSKIKAILKSTNIFITDIKIGELDELMVIDKKAYVSGDRKIFGYNYKESISKLNNLYKNKNITKKEFDEGKKLLKKDPTPIQLLEIIKKMRYEVLRWKPEDILNGYLKYRDYNISLEDALRSDGLFKIDFIVEMNDTFIEVSNIYDLRINGKRVSRYPLREDKTLLSDVITFAEEGKFYKALKRLFTYYHYTYRTKNNPEESKKMILKIFEILDSDIGKLSQINSTVGALISLLKNAKYINNNRIKAVINKLIPKLNNVSTIPVYIKNEARFMKMLKDAYNAKTVKQMLDIFQRFKSDMSFIIDNETNKKVRKDIGINKVKKPKT